MRAWEFIGPVGVRGENFETHFPDELTARLVSAAPEMLDALQGCADCLDFESHEHIRNAVLKALAKARGNS